MRSVPDWPETGWDWELGGKPIPSATLPIVVPRRPAWNRGWIVGQKRLLAPKHVWSIRVRLEMADNKRDLALFNTAIRTAVWNVLLQGLLPSRQCAEVRNGPVQADQPQQAFDEPASPWSLGPVAFPWLHLTERHSEQHIQRQTSLDGSVAVGRMPPVLASRRGLPAHRRVEPDREGPAALERFAVGATVPGPVGGGCRSAHAAQLPRSIHKMNSSLHLCNGAR